jgi:hypothetical protein
LGPLGYILVYASAKVARRFGFKSPVRHHDVLDLAFVLFNLQPALKYAKKRRELGIKRSIGSGQPA